MRKIINHMPFSSPPYMNDVLPYPSPGNNWLHSGRWRWVEYRFRRVCRCYGYREIRTPILELTDLFVRSVGEGTDIVSKEMFNLVDRGGRRLSLKPEGTAPVVRAIIEHELLAAHPLLKLYYIGQTFRNERGQKGRYRQHQQLGVEAFGSADPALDAEVIELAVRFFREIGITDQQLQINSVGCPNCRPAYREGLKKWVKPFLSEMCGDCKTRYEVNPLRMLDCKVPHDVEILSGAPKLLDWLCEDCREHFNSLRRHLEAMSVPYQIAPQLVRGFDYYTKTAFEITSGVLGSQNALGGGGRYDGLVEDCGGPATPGIGFGLGMERCLIAMESLGIEIEPEDEAPTVFLVALGESARSAAVRLLTEIRSAGIAADMDYVGKGLKAQMRLADKLKAPLVLLIGENELKGGVVSFRNMQTSQQEMIPQGEVIRRIQSWAKN
ncbi:MAG: histidine--tRNA ligase [Armatimonadetes bacterium]|nr:histidine--tRNA ligase [Armatimonadota bacterium]